jgi:hypothetical protein
MNTTHVQVNGKLIQQLNVLLHLYPMTHLYVDVSLTWTSPGRLARGTSDDNNSSHVDYSHMTTVQPVTTVRPSANRKKNNDQLQVGDTAAIHQPTHGHQSSTHDTDTMDTESTYVNTAQQQQAVSQ